jgi:hypothetical protein
MEAMRSLAGGGIDRNDLGFMVLIVDVAGEGEGVAVTISLFGAWLERRFCFRDCARDCGGESAEVGQGGSWMVMLPMLIFFSWASPSARLRFGLVASRYAGWNS